MIENGFKVGKSWLFFGCRHPDKNYLYRYVCMCDGYWSICTAMRCNQKCLLHVLLVVIGRKTCLCISWHFAEMFCQILIGNGHTI